MVIAIAHAQKWYHSAYFSTPSKQEKLKSFDKKNDENDRTIQRIHKI